MLHCCEVEGSELNYKTYEKLKCNFIIFKGIKLKVFLGVKIFVGPLASLLSKVMVSVL